MPAAAVLNQASTRWYNPVVAAVLRQIIRFPAATLRSIGSWSR